MSRIEANDVLTIPATRRSSSFDNLGFYASLLAHEKTRAQLQSLRVQCADFLVAALASCSRKPVAPAQAAPEVLITQVQQKDVPIYDDFVSTLDGSVNASIQARVQGYLTSQTYKEGAEVKKDALLFQIDPRPPCGRAGSGESGSGPSPGRSETGGADCGPQRRPLQSQGDQRSGARQCCPGCGGGECAD